MIDEAFMETSILNSEYAKLSDSECTKRIPVILKHIQAIDFTAEERRKTRDDYDDLYF